MPPTDWWDGLYRSGDLATLPWYTPNLDPDFAAAVETRKLDGARILDLGTGPATQAMNLARRGFDVVATDISPSAIRRARDAAKKEGLRIDFRVDDVLKSKLETGLVGAIVDRGVFHVLPPERRRTYVDTVHRVLRPRGWLFLKCFSDKEPGTYGPYRIPAKELRADFEKRFEILSIADAVFQGTLEPHPKALFATFRRR